MNTLCGELRLDLQEDVPTAIVLDLTDGVISKCRLLLLNNDLLEIVSEVVGTEVIKVTTQAHTQQWYSTNNVHNK